MLKECFETEYWIELLEKTEYLNIEKSKDLINSAGNLRRILIALINTTKKGM